MRRWLPISLAVLALGGVGVGVWALRPVEPEVPPAPAATPLPEFAQVEVQAPSNQGLTLTGTVRDSAGQPVAGAEVFLAATSQASLHGLSCATCGRELLSCPARETGLFVSSMLAARRGELGAAASTVADAKGEFRFEHLAGVSFTIWARAAQYGEGLKERAAPGDPVEIFLPALRAIAGHLVDAEGKPLQGRVHAISRRIAHHTEAASDEKGFFELKGLGEGPFYVLAEAPGKLPAVRPVVEAGPDLVSLTLVDPRRLEVTLTHQGKRVEGQVSLSADHVQRSTATSDGQGAFDGLYPDKVVITAVSGELSAAPQSVQLDARVTRVTLELERGGTVVVSVADENGDGVPAPTVSLLTVSGEVVLTKVGKTGERFSFGPLGVGGYRLHGVAEGYQAGDVPLTLGTGETAVELTLQKGTVISGRVLDEYGRPAPGVSVLISPTGESVLAGPEGKFVAPVPSPGLYELHAHHSDWGGGQRKVTAPATGVDLQLEPRAGVAVTVVADGRRVEGANVVMFIDREGNFRNDRPSGADGVVLMRGLPVGTYTMVAAHPDFLPADRQKITVADGQLLQVTATLKVGKSLTGEVVDQVGAPVPGVALGVLPRGAEPAVSDAEGKFEFKPLRPDGTYAVRVNQRGFEQINRVYGTAGGAPVKVVVKRQPVFRGRVVSGGKPVKHFRVDDHEIDSADGHFELPLPATEERVIFSVESPGYEPLMVDHPVTPDLGDLVLKPAASFSGVVHDEAGAPVADAVVGCEQCEQSTLSGPDGRFTLSSPPFLKSFVVSARKGRRTASREVTAGSGEIELQLKVGTRVTGVAYLPDGKPASGVEIQGIGADSSELLSVVTSADGSYTLEVPPGTYRFALNSPAMMAQSVDALAVITQVQGEQTRVDFGPSPGTSSLSVRVKPERGYALWLVRGELSGVGNPPLELLHATYAQLVYQPLQDRVLFSGLQPGRYTLVWASFHAESTGGPVVAPVSVPSVPEVSLVR